MSVNPLGWADQLIWVWLIDSGYVMTKPISKLMHWFYGGKNKCSAEFKYGDIVQFGEVIRREIWKLSEMVG